MKKKNKKKKEKYTEQFEIWDSRQILFNEFKNRWRESRKSVDESEEEEL